MVLAVEVENLSVGYVDEGEEALWAVRGVDLKVIEGSIHCIVGESGCGKSTLGKAIVGILPPHAVIKGVIKIFGEKVVDGGKTLYHKSRGKLVTFIPQNPAKALNPYLRIGDQFYYVMKSLRNYDKRRALEEAGKLLKLVGLPDTSYLNKYPHEFSGGMQQRIAIAMALANGAKIVVADEPTSFLDAHLRLQILKLLDELSEKLELTVIMITHDILMASGICDHLSVMYAGLIVEDGKCEEILRKPLHPYTKMLLKVVPVLGARKKLEPYVGNVMTELAVGTAFENSIEVIGGQKFPDIVAKKFYGIEVKTTTQNHWKTTGNSVLESTRVDDVERIFMGVDFDFWTNNKNLMTKFFQLFLEQFYRCNHTIYLRFIRIIKKYYSHKFIEEKSNFLILNEGVIKYYLI